MIEVEIKEASDADEYPYVGNCDGTIALWLNRHQCVPLNGKHQGKVVSQHYSPVNFVRVPEITIKSKV